MSFRFILCEDGSYLHVKNITRIWVAEDSISRRGAIKASTIGPAMPFTVAEYDTKNNAATALRELVEQMEREDQWA